MYDDNLKKGLKTQFTSDKQPTPQQKSEGKKRKSLIKRIATQLVTGDSKEALEDLATYLGIDIDAIDIETAMHLKQIELAVKEGDTRAYNAVMDRIRGKPMQAIEVKGDKTERPTFVYIKK